MEISRKLLDSQGTSDFLGVRFLPNTDPSGSIADFNAAFGVGALFTHQQRAAVDLLAMQQWVSECYARQVQTGSHAIGLFGSSYRTDTEGGTDQLADFTAIILDMKTQLKTITDKVRTARASRRGRTRGRSDKVEEAMAYGLRRRTCLRARAGGGALDAYADAEACGFPQSFGGLL
ncbi:hypothetical protein CYMTET_29940 [Cymbomonas tetramitiformis]|uniref:Uncharacterized protein n=1 Tax=Cymbomonas tetramitiformis TaxID=36881 RepID=A0AAE0FJZ7_9CHLO|nr:hypothetical protein CYMTET_29940 [Cymbomonas tetramitiformis]